MNLLQKVFFKNMIPMKNMFWLRYFISMIRLWRSRRKSSWVCLKLKQLFIFLENQIPKIKSIKLKFFSIINIFSKSKGSFSGQEFFFLFWIKISKKKMIIDEGSLFCLYIYLKTSKSKNYVMNWYKHMHEWKQKSLVNHLKLLSKLYFQILCIISIMIFFSDRQGESQKKTSYI